MTSLLLIPVQIMVIVLDDRVTAAILGQALTW